MKTLDVVVRSARSMAIAASPPFARQRPCTLLFLLLMTAASVTAVGATDEVRYSLFNDIEDAFKAANAAKANILAPDNYQESADLYLSASERYERGQSIKTIRDELTWARSYLAKSVEAAAVAEKMFGGAMQARNDAEAAEAQFLANTDWRSAEKTFADAARRLEAGDRERALTQGGRAEKLYRAAEWNANKNNYLGETNYLIEQANKDNVGRYAPRTLAKAESLLKEAERELMENRYDTDRLRSLVQQARDEAQRAVYIAFQIKSLRYKNLTEEDFIQRSEQPQLLPTKSHFIADPIQRPEPPRDAIASSPARQNDIAVLEAELQQLKIRLGTHSERLDEQEDYRYRFSQVEQLFSREEANVLVLTQEGNLLIRTFGVNFSPGSSQITPEYYPLLRKVQEAIRLFPNAHIVVEGHTDSVGRERQNLYLSLDRAEAVRLYLLYNMVGLREEQIEAVGYGESHPIANNATDEGRARNRRVDLILKR